MKTVQCEYTRHAEAILAIFNEAIVHTTALYDYKPRTLEMMATWFDTKAKGKYPIVGIESDSGELMGFASYGAFRAWPACTSVATHVVRSIELYAAVCANRATASASAPFDCTTAFMSTAV